MLKAFKLLLAVAFTGQTLLAPFWVMCHAPGPDGHDRLELAWATCCQDDGGHPGSSCNDALGGVPCASKPGGCNTCQDEKVNPSPIKVPSDAQPRVLAPVPSHLPTLAFLTDASPTARPVAPPDPAGDPPLFLAHCSFLV